MYHGFGTHLKLTELATRYSYVTIVALLQRGPLAGVPLSEFRRRMETEVPEAQPTWTSFSIICLEHGKMMKNIEKC